MRLNEETIELNEKEVAIALARSMAPRNQFVQLSMDRIQSEVDANRAEIEQIKHQISLQN